MLICNRCKQSLPLTSFYKNKSYPRGYSYTCKVCDSQRVKDTYAGKRKPKYSKTNRKSIIKYPIAPTVYTFYNSKDELIYIGITINLNCRIPVHRRSSSFYNEVEYIKISQYSSEVEMAIAEIMLINKYKPKHNRHIHKGDHNYNVPELPTKVYPITK